MYSGTDSCSSCGGCGKRHKYTDSCRGCNQSRPRLHWKVLFTRVWPNIVSLYNPFTRNRANSVTVRLIQVRTNFCQSQLWNGFLIKGAELGSTLWPRKLCKNFHSGAVRAGQNFWPTGDQVKNLHGSEGPCVYEMRIRARFCPFNNLSGPVKLHVRFWKKKKMSVSTFLKVVYWTRGSKLHKQVTPSSLCLQ